MKTTSGRLLACALLGGFVALATGCGQLTIRTWVTVIEEESGGALTLLDAMGVPLGDPLPITRVQGGMLTRVVLDTRDLPGPLSGTLALDDVRLAMVNEGLAGTICTWNDPDGDSSGSLTLDVLGGSSESDLFLDAKATTALSEVFGLPPTDFENDVDFALGDGFGIDTFLDALNTGSIEGAFATSTSLATVAALGPLNVDVAVDLTVTNGPLPPLFDPDLIAFCDPFFDEQGTATFHGLNAKSSYLLEHEDKTAEPIVIALDELGAVAGDTLRLSTVGTYAGSTLLRDGNETRTTGVFSSDGVVLDPSESHRIPGAIDAGSNYQTGSYFECILLFCFFIETDIPEDFRIDPTLDIVVPTGANYLIVAPYDSDLNYDENSGLGFGIDVEVNPSG